MSILVDPWINNANEAQSICLPHGSLPQELREGKTPFIVEGASLFRHCSRVELNHCHITTCGGAYSNSHSSTSFPCCLQGNTKLSFITHQCAGSELPHTDASCLSYSHSSPSTQSFIPERCPITASSLFHYTEMLPFRTCSTWFAQVETDCGKGFDQSPNCIVLTLLLDTSSFPSASQVP